MDQEERQHLNELKQNYIRRLRILEKRAAMEGTSTPPHVFIEIEDTEQDIKEIDQKLSNAIELPRPYAIEALSAKAQAILAAASDPALSFKGWFLKLSVLHSQDRLAVLHQLINSPQEKQGTAYLFNALANDIHKDEIEVVLDELVRNIVTTDDMRYKAKFMSTVPAQVLMYLPDNLRVALFQDSIQIMIRNTFKEVNLVTPAVIKIQAALPEELIEDYIKALLAQSITHADEGTPAARTALLSLSDEWAQIALQSFEKDDLVVMHYNEKFYKDFIERYRPLWPADRQELFEDYIQLPPVKLWRKYAPDEEE